LKSRSSFTNRRGISPVIATIILSAVVVTVGGAVWSYAQGAASVMASDYVNSTMSIMKEVTERFIVEHVSNNTSGTSLYVWIDNYGDVDITVDVYANVTSSGICYSTNLNNPLEIAARGFAKATINIEATGGDEIAIKVYSRRQNNAYFKYYMP
jgi:flagellin-like protein